MSISSAQEAHRESSDLARIWQAVTRHPGTWIVIVACAIGAALAVNRWMPREYEASASIVIESASDAIPALRLSTYAIGPSLVYNQIEEIHSRALAERVVRALTPAERATLAAFSSASEREQIEWLHRHVRARAVRDADVIKIAVQAPLGEWAASVANTLTDVLQENNVSVRRQEADALYQFLDEQLADVGTELLGAEDSLTLFKRENQVVALDKESEALLERISDLEVRRAQVRAERKALEARLVSVAAELGKQEGDLARFADATQPWLGRLKEKLVDLEVRHASLVVQDYPRDHPKLQKIQSQIEETRSRLSEEARAIAVQQAVADPLARWNDLILGKLNLELDLAGVRAHEETLEQELTRHDGWVRELPGKQLELLRLMRRQRLNEKLYLLLNEKREEARIARAGEIGNVRVIDPAQPPEEPLRPRPVLNLALAALLGVTVATGSCLALEASRHRIRGRSDIPAALRSEMLVEVPRVPASWARRVAEAGDGRGPIIDHLLSERHARAAPAVEAYRQLAARFTFLRTGDAPRSLLITSPLPGEGKSTTALYLALFAAESGVRTLLVDGDLRRPALHRMLGVHAGPGLVEILTGESDESVVQTGRLLPNLSFLPAGKGKVNTIRLLSSARFGSWLRAASESYGFVVIDGSPVLAACDVLATARQVEGTLMVLRSGRTLVEEARQAQEALAVGDIRLVGTVLNDVNWRRIYGRHYYYSKVRRYHAA